MTPTATATTQNRMKEFLCNLMIIAGLASGTGLLATGAEVELEAKVVTIKGRATCLKNGLKEDDYCKTVLLAERNGVPTKYYVVPNEVAKKFHPEVCADTKPAKVTGLVRKVLDRYEITPARIQLE